MSEMASFHKYMRLTFILLRILPVSAIARASPLSRHHDRTQTRHTRQHSSRRAKGQSQRPLPHTTQHAQETDIHALGRIRNRTPNQRAAADPRLRPRGHWNRQSVSLSRSNSLNTLLSVRPNIHASNSYLCFTYI
jgi:hypothetical protein